VNADVTSASVLSPSIREFCGRAPKGPTYLAEAEFCLRQIEPYLNMLAAGSRVLEVGSGPCIALSAMARRYPEINFEGIESMGSGFAVFKQFIKQVNSGALPFALFRGGYEDFPRTADWDLIFLVNVFEHLPDWRDFLDFVRESLSPGGKCVILCPNAGFPCESHFRLPVLGNKSFTRTVFRRRIDAFEPENGWEGLYDRLNFVKFYHVLRAAARAGLKMTVRPQIVVEMIERLQTDAEFARRQGPIAGLARLAKRSGALHWPVDGPLVETFMPYMRVETDFPR
jgi:SAM-dependent methyltransferase